MPPSPTDTIHPSLLPVPSRAQHKEWERCSECLRPGPCPHCKLRHRVGGTLAAELHPLPSPSAVGPPPPLGAEFTLMHALGPGHSVKLCPLGSGPTVSQGPQCPPQSYPLGSQWPWFVMGLHPMHAENLPSCQGMDQVGSQHADPCCDTWSPGIVSDLETEGAPF